MNGSNVVSDLPRITVVMPNYNDSEYIGRAIESVLGQDYPDLEFIIVDDTSTDNSVEIIRSYGDAVTLICHEENKGHAAAVNTGLSRVSGDLVCWLNSNDSFVPGALPEVGRYFLRNPEVNVIFGDFNVIDVHDRVLLRQRVLPLDYAYGCMIGFGNLVTVSTMFMRKHVLDAVGLLDESYHYVPDNEFIFRVAQEYHIQKVGLRIANWRHHPSSITMRGRKTIWNEHDADIERAQRTSYSTLGISRWIPFEYSGVLRFLFKVKRVFQRLVRFHYLAYLPMVADTIRHRWASLFRRDAGSQSEESSRRES
jgi:glycosyltransferase involved in cell wall biosynthesis